MNMPKSRDIQAKIPLPQAIWNFGYVTVNGVNSNVLSTRPARCFNKYLTDISNLWYVYHTKTGVDFSVL